MVNVIWIITGLIAAYIAYDLFFGKKGGTMVYVEWYKLINDQIVRHNQHKIIKAYHRRKGVTDALFLPKKMASRPIEGCHPRDFHMTTSGAPVIKLLELSPGIYTNMREFSRLSDKQQKELQSDKIVAELIAKNPDLKTLEQFKASYDTYIVEKDVAYWAEQADEEAKQRHAVQDWKSKIAPFVLVGLAIIVAFLIVRNAQNDAIDMTMAAQEQSWDEIADRKEEANTILNVVKGLAGGNGENQERPPAQEGGG